VGPGAGQAGHRHLDGVKALLKNDSKNLRVVRGNHDKAVCGLDSIETFNPIAASAIHWTKERILKKNINFLCRLRTGPQLVEQNIEICHGAPFDEDYYKAFEKHVVFRDFSEHYFKSSIIPAAWSGTKNTS
jgi:hypothetical protein